MSRVFPEWTNATPRALGALAGFAGICVIGIVWYYFTPKFWEVGYQPEQPIAFSHQIHAGVLGMDCRYCHTNVEESGHSNVPDTATCMNCHTGEAGVGGYLNSTLWAAHETNEHLVALRSAYNSGEAIRWARIHIVPDYAHFNHAIHVNAGVSCYSCHGRIDRQEVVRQVEPLSMGWCLECHRAPEKHLVDVTDPAIGRITNLMAVEAQLSSPAQLAQGMRLAEEKQLQPPEYCGACHY